MSKSDIWMPLYIGDYLADTQLLTTEQHGAYFLLIMAYWKNKGPLPDDDKILSGICKMSSSDWKKSKPVISKFFDTIDGCITHKRIDAEMVRSADKRESSQKKARLGAVIRWAKASGYDLDAKSKELHTMLEAMPQAMPEAIVEAMLERCPKQCLKVCYSQSQSQPQSQSQSQSQPQSPVWSPLPEENSRGVVDTATGELIAFGGAK